MGKYFTIQEHHLVLKHCFVDASLTFFYQKIICNAYLQTNINMSYFVKRLIKVNATSKKFNFKKGNLSFYRCLRVFYADLASADSISNVSCFKGLFLRFLELLVVFNCSQPEAESVGEVVASTLCTVTLDEWCGSEVFQARTWAGE